MWRINTSKKEYIDSGIDILIKLLLRIRIHYYYGYKESTFMYNSQKILQIPSNIIEALNCPEFCSGNGKCDVVGIGGCVCNDNYLGASCDKMVKHDIEDKSLNAPCNASNTVDSM